MSGDLIHWASPTPPPAALEGVRSRRIFAAGLDLAFVLVAFVLDPFLLLLVDFFFDDGLTVSGPRTATPGMALMGLEMRSTNGGPVVFLQVAVHAILFYVSWLFPPILLVSLFAHDKRCLHDMVAGVIVLRRPV